MDTLHVGRGEMEEEKGESINGGGERERENGTTYVNPTLIRSTTTKRERELLVPKSTECYRDVNLILCQRELERERESRGSNACPEEEVALFPAPRTQCALGPLLKSLGERAT